MCSPCRRICYTVKNNCYERPFRRRMSLADMPGICAPRRSRSVVRKARTANCVQPVRVWKCVENERVPEPPIVESRCCPESTFVEPRCYPGPRIVEPRCYPEPQIMESRCYSEPEIVQPRCYPEVRPRPVE